MKRTPRDLEREHEEATLRMMQSDRDWPSFVLPMKNSKLSPGSWPITGVLMEPITSFEQTVKIYIGNMFAGDFSDEDVREYPSVQSAISAGWRVD